MTSFRKKILLSFFLIFLAIVAMVFMSSDEQSKRDKETQPARIKAEENLKTKSQQKENRMDSALSLEKDISIRKDECEQSAKKLFPSNDSFNINTDQFKNPQRVIEKLHDTFRTTLLSKESIETYERLSSEQPPGPETSLTKKMQERLNAYVVCRPEVSIRYIETVLQAYKEKKWDEETRQEIVYVITTMMANVTADNFAPANIKFIYKTLLQLVQYELISKREKNDINAAYEDFKAMQVNNQLDSFKALEEEGRKAHRLLELAKKKYAPDYK